MKRSILLLLTCIVGSVSLAQTARLQVIHNSADAAASTVDIYVNANLFLDDVDFRTASAFTTVPANVQLDVGIAPGNSTSANDTIANFEYTLAANETYIVVAQGIVSPTGYSPATPFGLAVYGQGREEAGMAGNTDVLVAHGATDAPTVDVVESEVANLTLVNGISYNEFDGYLELATDDYVIDVETQAGAVVASYEAPLEALGLEDSAITVLASGFLDPSVNSGGEAFGLFAVLPSGGDFIPLPNAIARLQVIHNSADALAAEVDIYLDGELLLDDFAFRTASPFVNVTAGVEHEIAVAPAASTSANQAVATVSVTLDARDTYVAIANGIISPIGYTPAPAFSLDINAMGQEEAAQAGNTDVLVFHGSTDAPEVDVIESGVGAGPLFENLEYGDYDGYAELGTDDYVLDIATQAGDNVFSYEAPLAALGLEDSALVVVASGFLDPSNNSDGSAFGLFVALPSGGDLVELPQATSRLQVIHNSADAAAATVDVYLNGDMLIDNFEFRTASAFIDAPANVEIEVAVAPGNSMDVNDAIATFPLTLDYGMSYIAVADGIVSTTGYVNPGSFGLSIYDMAREMASNANNTDVLVHHGSTDAPTVDVNEVLVGAGTIVDDIAYGEFQGYLELATVDYTLDVMDETNTDLVAQYQAPLSTLGLGGEAITVIASGFLDPTQNSDGPAFGLWVSLADGGALVELPSTPTGVEEAKDEQFSVYPNPVIGNNFTLTTSADAGSISLFSIDGRLVKQQNVRNTLNQVSIDGLDAGNYLIRFEDDKGNKQFNKLQIVK